MKRYTYSHKKKTKRNKHSTATRAIENVMDINTLSAILDHAQTSTTVNRHYLAIEEHKKSNLYF